MHIVQPLSFSGYIQSLCNTHQLLKNASGYRLADTVRDSIAAIYEPVGYKVQVTQVLRSLPAQIPNLAEQTYLNEALICYENGAFRAALVMTWNLAYYHLCAHIIDTRLTDFNSQWCVKFPNQHKSRTRTIGSIDDFMQELKESEVIVICRDAGIITKDIWKILDEKLGKRNSAAHPSSIIIGQLQTDAFIDDLIKNVVLKIR